MLKYYVWDVGKTIYNYSLRPLSNLFENRGIHKFDYNPYMRGEQTFKDFCEKLCNECRINVPQSGKYFAKCKKYSKY